MVRNQDKFMTELKELFEKYLDKGLTLKEMILINDLYIDTVKKELMRK